MRTIKTRGATRSHKLVREIKTRVAKRSHKLREWQQLSKMSKIGISQMPGYLGNFPNA